MLSLNSRGSKRTRSRMILGIIGLGVWLLGCANVSPEKSMGTPLPPGASETRVVTGIPILSAPDAQTPTPYAGSAKDAPISSGDTATTVPVPTTADAAGGASGITGRVSDSNKQPIAGAVVIIVKGTAEFPERTWRTNAKGEYMIDVPAGTFTVAVNAEGFKQVQKDAEVAEGKLTQLDFELEKE